MYFTIKRILIALQISKSSRNTLFYHLQQIDETFSRNLERNNITILFFCYEEVKKNNYMTILLIYLRYLFISLFLSFFFVLVLFFCSQLFYFSLNRNRSWNNCNIIAIAMRRRKKNKQIYIFRNLKENVFYCRFFYNKKMRS